MEMRAIVKLLGCAAVFACASASLGRANAADTATASAGRMTTNSIPVGRCVNLGNHLESPNEGDWGRKISDDDFKIIATAGFTTIRLPVKWSGHSAATAPYMIDPAFMARVKHLVAAARANHLKIILNDHNFDALMTDPDANRDRLAGIWRQVAAAFADQPRDELWFEIENEPHDKLTNANLVATLSPSLAAIRETNPDRPVVIGGEFWSGINSLATLQLPNDPNLVPTFHYYDPFPFTHQGANWIKPMLPMGRVYGGADDKALLAADVQKVRAYIERTGKTPFMGEFGANDLIATDQRVLYYKTIREGYDPLGIGQCAWAYANTFPLYDNAHKSWIPGMLDAMGVKQK